MEIKSAKDFYDKNSHMWQTSAIVNYFWELNRSEKETFIDDAKALSEINPAFKLIYKANLEKHYEEYGGKRANV